MKILRPVTITDAKLIATNVSEPYSSESEYNAGTSYGAAGTGGRTTSDRVILAALHTLYEYVYPTAASGHAPNEVASAYWVEVSADNRWAMLDGTVSSQTTQAANIDVTVFPDEPIDSIALIGINATKATITVTDPTAGIVYGPTVHALTDPLGIQDWYAYFFEPTQRVVDYVIENLPPHSKATIRVLIESSDTAAIGELVFGRARTIGGTQYGVNLGIQDYSIKQANQWGEYTITERAFAKRADFGIVVEPEFVDALQALLATYRAVPVVYIGSSDFGSMIVYGFYKDFTIDVAYSTVSFCTLNIEGLT